jgi:NAD(P) transhydrogenase subunit alpha
VLRERDVLAFAMELVPRISRAQSMDALSSQALVAGYRRALVRPSGCRGSSRCS